MKRIMCQLCALFMVIVCCVGMVGNASAASKASFYLTTYTASVSALSGGDIEIRFNTGANQTAGEVGAEYILLERSSDGGKTWVTAREYSGESWMSTTNRSTYASSSTYHGVVGCQYRVTATLFAYNSPSAQDSKTVGPSGTVTAHN